MHLYVATAWVDGWFEGAEVDHIDYDRNNFHANNLRWVTHLDNIRHSYIDENHYAGNHKGAANGRAVMTAEQVDKIKEMFNSGMSTTDVIRALHPGYSYNERRAVWNRYNRIKTGETWQQ